MIFLGDPMIDQSCCIQESGNPKYNSNCVSRPWGNIKSDFSLLDEYYSQVSYICLVIKRHLNLSMNLKNKEDFKRPLFVEIFLLIALLLGYIMSGNSNDKNHLLLK